jgi:uncharacterized protein
MRLLSPDFTLAGQHPLALLALFCVGVLACGINAVAGGGSLVAFPVLVALGVPPLAANATNAVALWPGSLSSAFGFLEQLKRTGRYLWVLVLPTVLGSLFGAWLLTHTPERLFAMVVPALILLATLLLAFQPQIRKRVLAGRAQVPTAVGVLLQFLVSVYGGYFGAGMGIIMLAVFGLFIHGSMHDQGLAWGRDQPCRLHVFPGRGFVMVGPRHRGHAGRHPWRLSRGAAVAAG